MYRSMRVAHRWVGLINALFLLLIAATGFLLATKNRVDWIRPMEREGQKVESMAEVVSIDKALNSAYAVGLAELKTVKDIDRVDYRPKRNVFKILSKEGYHEVQVCGKTGEVLHVAKRVDQFTEDLHDMSFFGDSAHDFLLPLIGLSLFLLALSGIVIFFVPIVRRIQHQRKNPKPAAKTS